MDMVQKTLHKAYYFKIQNFATMNHSIMQFLPDCSGLKKLIIHTKTKKIFSIAFKYSLFSSKYLKPT